MEKFDLKQAFADLQDQMRMQMESNRRINTHAPTKGDVTEAAWCNWLEKYLPKRYCVSKAFVVDCNGYRSQQLDLVIYDRQYSPFVFEMQNEALYIPAESVYAVFEVKQDLTKERIVYAAEKIKSVRLLNRTNARTRQAGKGDVDPLEYHRIIGGILTLDCNAWKEAFGEPFTEAIRSLESNEEIDLGCVLAKGSFTVSYSPENQPDIQISTPHEALIYFFLKLFDRLQKLGTVPAIEIYKYARVLDSF
jgi:hypothetical protein